MKEIINGQIVDMTPEREKQWREYIANFNVPDLAPTPEERLAALESAMIAMMGSGQNV